MTTTLKLPSHPTLLQCFRYRARERVLLFHSVLLIFFGLMITILVKAVRGDSFLQRDWLLAGYFALICIFLHLSLVVIRFRGDIVLPSLAATLAGIGILFQYRMGTLDISSFHEVRYLVYPGGAFLTLCILLLLKNGRYRVLQRLTVASAILSSFTVLAVIFLGIRFRGAHFAPGHTTPTEALKILIPIFVAGYLLRHHGSFVRTWFGIPIPAFPHIIIFLGLWGLPQVLLIFQRDLGLILIFTIVLLAMFLFATGKAGYLFIGLLLGALAILSLSHFPVHGQERIAAWLRPLDDPTDTGWQILQALTAMFSGGFFGSGLGLGSPHRIPIVTTDFIYAAIGEELGFLGTGMVLMLYVLFLIHAYRVCARSRNHFAYVLGSGLVTCLGVQILLNIGGNIKLLPITGVTLPFISKGGSSLVTNYIILGILLAISEPIRAPRSRIADSAAINRSSTVAGEPERRKSSTSSPPTSP